MVKKKFQSKYVLSKNRIIGLKNSQSRKRNGPEIWVQNNFSPKKFVKNPEIYGHKFFDPIRLGQKKVTLKAFFDTKSLHFLGVKKG